MSSRALGPLCATLLLVVAAPARAFDVPAAEGYVSDPGRVLSASDRAALDQKLRSYDQSSGNQVVVFIPVSLGGEPREDVAYQVFQKWKIGQRGKDNGVLLLWAPKERQVYIQTGKGVGGDLTDIQSFRIIQQMKPALRDGRNAEALDVGTDGIIAALGGSGTQTPAAPAAPVALPRFFDLCFWGFILFVVVMLLLRSSRHPRRRTYWGGPPFIGGGWGGGGGGGDWGGGGGDSGGGGFSGGGGETGGGGGGDSY